MMIKQRPLAQEITRQQKPLRGRIPYSESKIADQLRKRTLTPALESCEQDRRIAELTGRDQAKLCRQFVAIVETDIGDQRQASIAASQRLTVMDVFRERPKKPATHG